MGHSSLAQKLCGNKWKPRLNVCKSILNTKHALRLKQKKKGKRMEGKEEGGKHR